MLLIVSALIGCGTPSDKTGSHTESSSDHPVSVEASANTAIEGEYFCRIRDIKKKQIDATMRCTVQSAGPGKYSLNADDVHMMQLSMHRLDSTRFSISGTAFISADHQSSRADRWVRVEDSLLTENRTGNVRWHSTLKTILQFKHEHDRGDIVDARTGVRTPSGAHATLELSIHR